MIPTKVNSTTYTKRHVYDLQYHLIWTTKNNMSIFDNTNLHQELNNAFQTIANANEINLINVSIMPNYVHLTLSFPPRKAAVNIIKALKGRSAFLLLKQHPEIRNHQNWDNHLWSPSYYLSTSGVIDKNAIKAYLQNQQNNAH